MLYGIKNPLETSGALHHHRLKPKRFIILIIQPVINDDKMGVASSSLCLSLQVRDKTI